MPVSKIAQSDSRGLDGRFAKGHPGGPGRPRKAVKAAADRLDEQIAEAAGDVFEVALSLAKERNIAAVKMLLDRVWPVGRHRALEIAIPEIRGAQDLLPSFLYLPSPHDLAPGSINLPWKKDPHDVVGVFEARWRLTF